MNRTEIKPSTENVIDMLEKDAIDRNKYIVRFLEMLDNTDYNFTIFINGDWGTGKTFVVKQIYNLLIYYNEYIKAELEDYKTQLESIKQKEHFRELKLEKNFVPIYYNAWSNDSHIDPINSIIFNIIKEHNILKDYKKESSDLIDKIASVMDIANIWSNGSVKNLVDTFKGKDIVEEITTIENVKDTLNTLLNKLLEESGDKLVIFIDELDRCNPIYAIKLLERIKHFFDNDNIIFVFSVNMNELTNTISNYYGQNFDSHRYLNKFFDISIDLPQINITNFMMFLGFDNNSYYFNEIVFEIINHFHFTMRDCIRYYQSICVVEDFANTQQGCGFYSDTGRFIIRVFFLPLLLGVKIIDLKAYIDIINGNGYNKFFEYIKQIEIIQSEIKCYMTKDETGNISEESYKDQLLKMYNAIFNRKSQSYNEYSNNMVAFNMYSYDYMMEALSLLKKELKY